MMILSVATLDMLFPVNQDEKRAELEHVEKIEKELKKEQEKQRKNEQRLANVFVPSF